MLKVTATMGANVPLREVVTHAQRVESLGYDTLSVAEAVHDGMLSSMAALGGHRRFCDGGAWRWMRTHALCSDQLRSRTHAFAQPFDLSRWSE